MGRRKITGTGPVMGLGLHVLLVREIAPGRVELPTSGLGNQRSAGALTRIQSLPKDANRNYVFNNNNITLDPFWGLIPLGTTKMGVGNFLVGSGSPSAVEIRDRMQTTVTISTEHANFFVENKVALLAESRLALAVYRPGAFVFGSFTTSP